MTSVAIDVRSITHHYGERRALSDVSFSVGQGEIFGLLGPNGGGKTTLFRLLSTLMPIQEGEAEICGASVAKQPDAVRRLIGVTFQSPSLDGKLTVAENLNHQGHLYGLSGRELGSRRDELLAQLGLSDRAGDYCEELSGGLKRRVEIAKGLLHSPQVLLLDEPSTGLDPGARHDLWRYLGSLRETAGVTVLVTTHLMEEAERCGRLAILDEGVIVAEGTPDALRASIGGDCITIRSENVQPLAGRIHERFGIEPLILDDALRIEHESGHDLLRDLVEAFPNDVRTVSLGKPTLEDVFIQRTGHRFWAGDPEPVKKRSRH